MPSHLAHTVFAKHAFDAAGLPWTADDDGRAVFGAQGPDIFYHNRRTKPSGLHYGGLLHRKSYGTFLANVAAFLKRHGDEQAHAGRDYVCAAATHAVLDRAIHPFINYHSGWHRPGDNPIMRFTHAFLERLIDVAVVHRFWKCEAWEVDFAASVDLGPELPRDLERAIRYGLRATYPRAGRDLTLSRRLANAYHDARGFYHYTNKVDPGHLRRRAAETGLSTRALTVIHPPWLPDNIDFLNEEHREWSHPCDANMRSRESLWDLYDHAVEQAQDVVAHIATTWDRPSTHTDVLAQTVQSWVTDVNLSDGLEENATCRREHSDPLPLPEFLEKLRRELTEDAGT